MTSIQTSADRDLPMSDRIALRRTEYADALHLFTSDPETLDHQTDDEIAADLTREDDQADNNAKADAERRAANAQRQADELLRLSGPVTDATIFDVSYVNEFGEMGITAEFDLAGATQMAATLYRVAAWGKVTSVTLTRSERSRTY